LRNGSRVQYEVKLKVSDAVEERRGKRCRREGRVLAAIYFGVGDLGLVLDRDAWLDLYRQGGFRWGSGGGYW
jgi:hypothetical protein